MLPMRVLLIIIILLVINFLVVLRSSKKIREKKKENQNPFAQLKIKKKKSVFIISRKIIIRGT